MISHPYFQIEPADSIRARVEGVEEPLFVRLQLGDKVTLRLFEDELATVIAVLKEALAELKAS